ncbi:MAG TPA: SOS response-associated peptidase [Sandaracinaceae bacterium]
MARRILRLPMCARYTMTRVSAEELSEEFGLVAVQEERLAPRYNIAPTEDAPIVVESKEGERRLRLARFGLVPHWAKGAKIGTRFLNARVETVAETPAFRDAFARHRCLVVADGFYEWHTEGKVKIPHWFHLPDRRLFAFAGLWAVWRDPEGKWVTSFAILTRPAEGPALAVHDRMPVVLAPEVYGAWLARDTKDARELMDVLAYHRAGELEEYVVSRAVNKAGQEDPSFIEPA